MKNIWDFQALVTRRLLWWGGLSVVAGLLLWPLNAFWRGVGVQSMSWGAIDGLIALVGGWFTRRRFRRLPNPLATEVVTEETTKLRRILWFNTGLDVLYVLSGLWLAVTKKDDRWRGYGWGIVLQGGFLFFFDWLHARRLSESSFSSD